MEVIKLSNKDFTPAMQWSTDLFLALIFTFILLILKAVEPLRNLVNIDPDPDKIEFNMPVKVIYGGTRQKDKEGNSYLSYFFEPA